MPATYTYNDALDDAKGAVGQAISDAILPLDEAAAKPYVDLLLAVMGRLNGLKRPTRRKRSSIGPRKMAGPLDKILDEARKGLARS